MAPSPEDFPPTSAPALSSHARDRGLHRSRRTALWIAVTASAGTAALGGVYAHVLPAGSAAPAPANAPVHHPAASTAATVGKTDEGSEVPNGHEDGEGNDDEEGAAPVTQPAPQPPAQPPAATQQQPQTTTGAS